MGINSEKSDPVACLKEMLYTEMSENCRRCIDARMAVCEVVKVIPSKEAVAGEELVGFREFMANCGEGPSLVGECGTARNVCQHPDKVFMQASVDAIFSNHFEPITQHILQQEKPS